MTNAQRFDHFIISHRHHSDGSISPSATAAKTKSDRQDYTNGIVVAEDFFPFAQIAPDDCEHVYRHEYFEGVWVDLHAAYARREVEVFSGEKPRDDRSKQPLESFGRNPPDSIALGGHAFALLQRR